jgi:hypothetical protein
MGLLVLVVPSAAETVGYNYCQSAPLRSDAVDFPSKHAWDLFLMLNHPAVDRTIERGQPDCSKPIGAPGSTAVWESWRNGASEVFLPDGSEPPPWGDNSKPDEKPGRVPTETIASVLKTTAAMDFDSAREVPSFHDLALLNTIRPQFSPDDGVYTGSGGFGETRVNRSAYEFIKHECLWSKQGLQRYGQAFLAGKKPLIVFPPDAMEVKAAWLDFADPQGDGSVAPIPIERQKTYYTAELTTKDNKTKKYGLTTLHVLTKDVPNWFWASFHHVDHPKNPYEDLKADKYGRPKVLAGTVWENYVLGGTQIEFETSIGHPSILSDSYVEKGFLRSSCITCHATAVLSPDGTAPVPNQQRAICILEPNTPDVGLSYPKCRKLIGDRYFIPDKDELVIERGAPLPEWFEKGGKLFYLPTDFLYSLPQRAKNETSAPPDRCKW